MAFVLIEILEGVGKTRRCFEIPQGGLRFEVKGDSLVLLEAEKRCSLCGNSGGRRYFFAQDDFRGVSCPRCSGGSQDRWDALEREWDEHCRATC